MSTGRILMMEGARIIYPNFSGRATDYTPEGDRHFTLVVPEKIAQYLEANNLPVRRLKPREGDDPNEPTTAVIRVKISSLYFPDIVTLSGSDRWVPHNQDTVGQLDRITFQRSAMRHTTFDSVDVRDTAVHGEFPFMNIDLKCQLSFIQKYRRYAWYLQWMRAWVESDRLDEKYAKLGVY